MIVVDKSGDALTETTTVMATHRVLRRLAWPVTAGALAVLVLAGNGAVLGELGENPKDETQKPIPIIYSTDLFHPHADPDDHYDLATLFALDEFDIKGIILDLGDTQKQRMGDRPVKQMMHITDRRVPYAVGLSGRLRTPDDRGLNEPDEFQGGVRLILSVLRESRQKVTIFTTGSVRDVAAAFNREPALLRQKVRAVYFNVGTGPDGPQGDCNVRYDPPAYARLFESGLPLYWCPCLGRDGFATFFCADQREVVGACEQRVQGYFAYCLTKSKASPIRFLESGAQPLPRGPRNMWCTAPFFHAAGRSIYELPNGEYAAGSMIYAATLPAGTKRVEVFEFVPADVRIVTCDPATDELPTVKPGELRAALVGQGSDRVGTRSLEPDGRLDCHVRVVGIDPAKPIANIVLTSPRDGRWEHVDTGRWWRVGYDRQGNRLECYFTYYASGEHTIEFTYADGSTQAVKFDVVPQSPARLATKIGPDRPNVQLFRATHGQYGEIMASCLKNLLAELGR